MDTLLTVVVTTALLLALAGCPPRPARATAALRTDSSSSLWCVPGLSDTGEAVLARAELPESCGRMRKAALRWGQLAHIDEVGRCEHLEVSP